MLIVPLEVTYSHGLPLKPGNISRDPRFAASFRYGSLRSPDTIGAVDSPRQPNLKSSVDVLRSPDYALSSFVRAWLLQSSDFWLMLGLILGIRISSATPESCFFANKLRSWFAESESPPDSTMDTTLKWTNLQETNEVNSTSPTPLSKLIDESRRESRAHKCNFQSDSSINQIISDSQNQPTISTLKEPIVYSRSASRMIVVKDDINSRNYWDSLMAISFQEI
ncbi:hypothetical protein RUND412_006242 [Rhizina undulata]